MSGYSPAKNTFWSKEMILKSIEFLDPIFYDNLPEELKERINGISTVVLKRELDELLEDFSECETLIKKMDTLREHSSFTNILGLHGYINKPSRSSSSLPIREWLYIIAVKLFQIHENHNKVLPECSRIVAHFEASKLAEKITDNVIIKSCSAVVEKMESLYKMITEHLDSEKQYRGEIIEEMEKYLFDDTKYYLIPEFYYWAEYESNEDPNLWEHQIKLLYESKQYFEIFFQKVLTHCSPFNYSSKSYLSDIVQSSKFQIPLFSYAPPAVFVKTAKDYLIFANNTENNVANMDPNEVMLSKDYKKWLETSNLTDSRFQPVDLDVQREEELADYIYLPIVSPKYQLRVMKITAFWEYLTIFEKADRIKIPTKYFPVIKLFVETFINFLGPYEASLSTVDYKRSLALMNSTRKKIKEIEKEVINSSYSLLKDVFSGFTGHVPKSSETLMGMIYTFPKVAILFHHQKECDALFENSKKSECLLDMVDNEHKLFLKKCGTPSKSNPITLCAEKQKPLTTSSKKSVEAAKKVVKSSRKASTSSRKHGKTSSRASSSGEESSSSSTRKKANVMEFQQVVRPILEVQNDVALFNTHIIKKCLDTILDADTYQTVVGRKNLKLPEKHKWINWIQLVDLMANVRDVIPNFDAVLTDILSIRKSPGSAILFKTGICLDWQNPNGVSMSKETGKTSDLKQHWIQALPFADHFYENDSYKDLFKILMGYKLDQLAASIRRSEVVTLKCPQSDLNKIMLDVKLKLRNENRGQAREFMKNESQKFNDDMKDEQLVKVLKEVAFEASDHQIIEEFENVLLEHLKTCKNEKDKKQVLLKNVLYKIHKARRIREALSSDAIDRYGITKPFDKQNMNHIPIVRTARNDTIVFEQDVRFALDVAKLLKDPNYVVSESEDKSDVNPTFNYIPKHEVLQFCQAEGFEDVPFEMINLEGTAPSSTIRNHILSPNYTLCIEARTILDQILNILTKMKVLEKLNSKNIDDFTIFIDGLMKYFKPENTSLFCIDYEKAKLLLETTSKKFKEFSSEAVKPKYSGKKGQKKAVDEARFLPSFAPILSSMNTENLSKKDMEHLIEMADIRTLFYEYPKLGIVYHNQGMCHQDGKLAFCPLDYINQNMSFNMPKNCNFTNINVVDGFNQKMKESGVTRLPKCVVEDSKNELKQYEDFLTIDQEEQKTSSSCTHAVCSISTQTDVPLALDKTIQDERQLQEDQIRQLNDIVRRNYTDLFNKSKEVVSLKKEVTELKKTSKMLDDKVRKMEGDHLWEENRLQGDKQDLRKILEKCQKENVKLHQIKDEQERLIEALQKELEKLTKEKLASTSSGMGTTHPFEFFLNYIDKAENAVKAAKSELEEFNYISTDDSDKHRAEKELNDFEDDMNYYIGKAQKNLFALEEDGHINSDLLSKVPAIHQPFSQLTYSKMRSAKAAKFEKDNQECNICKQNLNGEEAFPCQQCTYVCHQVCFDRWAETNSKCPACQIKVDSQQK